MAQWHPIHSQKILGSTGRHTRSNLRGRNTPCRIAVNFSGVFLVVLPGSCLEETLVLFRARAMSNFAFVARGQPIGGDQMSRGIVARE